MTTTDVLRWIRITVWTTIGLVLAVGGTILLGHYQQTARLSGELPGAARIGGAFELTKQDGSRFSSASLDGNPYLLFFGFTHCPDICPTTLQDLTVHLSELGPAGDRIKAVFVTVDPERDTPGKLESYLSAFDLRIVGLTGTPAEVSKVVNLYRAFSEKVPSAAGDYTMNHTASVYMMDSKGNLVSTLSFEEKPEVRKKKLENLASR